MNKKQIAHLIWDLSGTLVKTDCSNEKLIPASANSLLVYLWGGKKEPSSLDKKALTILDTFGQQQGPEHELIRFPDNALVPLLVCQWLAGSLTSQQITNHALRALEKARLDSEEETRIAALYITAFDPEQLAACTHPLPTALRLFKQFLPQIPVYALSNWDKESFEVLYKAESLQPLFAYLPRSHIMISADAHAIKPQKKIYDIFFHTYNLNPSSCLFIDNQDENLVTAATCGSQTLLFEDDYDKMYQHLKALTILT